MRHRKDGRQFSRNTSHRRAMFRNLAANLVNHERILTTDAKAKRLGDVAYTPHADLDDGQRAKRLAVARNLRTFLPPHGVGKDGEQKDLIEKVMVELAKRFADRPGGYTRIIKVGPRKGDGAPMSLIEFVDAAPVGVFEDDDDEASEETEAASTDEEASEGEASDEDAGDDD